MFLQKTPLLWIIFIIILLSITGCTSFQGENGNQIQSDISQKQLKAQEVTFQQLKSNHEKYEGKLIAVTGYIFWGWEWCFLSEDFQFVETVEKGYYKNKGEKIDIRGGIEEDIKNKLYLQRPLGAGDYFGKLKLIGVFGYGPVPMRGYGYYIEIVPNGVEVPPWAPPILPYSHITEK